MFIQCSITVTTILCSIKSQWHLPATDLVSKVCDSYLQFILTIKYSTCIKVAYSFEPIFSGSNNYKIFHATQRKSTVPVNCILEKMKPYSLKSQFGEKVMTQNMNSDSGIFCWREGS